MTNVESALTSDNPPLSKVKTDDTRIALLTDFEFASSCTRGSGGISDEVRSLVESSIAPATRIAYRSDLAHFHAWGGSLPASDQDLAAYIASHAQTFSVATLSRRIVAIGKAHRTGGWADPAASELVRATMRGIRRTRGSAQDAAKPLLRDDLFRVLNCIGDRKKDLRDRALLLIGFACGFRRSELIGLDTADIAEVRQGLIVTLRRSKTDQEGRGRRVGIPHGRSRHCPVVALATWRSVSRVNEGPIFRPIDRHGQIGSARLSGDAVSVIVRERLSAAGVDPAGYSAHSLRSGLCTSAANAGVSSWKIRQMTGHQSDAMLDRYVRDGQLFLDNAAGALL